MRDQIPISAPEWREKRGAPEISFVFDRDKELVWKAVTDVFIFDTNDEELKVRIYDWTMNKMAVLLQNWKKSLYNKFVKKNETPNFNLKQYVKLRAFWDDFVQYKTSEEGEERANRNKENASKKTFRRLEAFVLQSEEREKAREEWIHAEIQRQVQAALSEMTKGQGTSQPEVNVSPPGQLKSSYASMKVPTIQGATKLHFPVDDVTEAFTTYELHIPGGNETKKVAIYRPNENSKNP